jgi:hypothetical protein
VGNGEQQRHGIAATPEGLHGRFKEREFHETGYADQVFGKPFISMFTYEGWRNARPGTGSYPMPTISRMLNGNSDEDRRDRPEFRTVFQ